MLTPWLEDVLDETRFRNWVLSYTRRDVIGHVRQPQNLNYNWHRSTPLGNYLRNRLAVDGIQASIWIERHEQGPACNNVEWPCCVMNHGRAYPIAVGDFRLSWEVYPEWRREHDIIDLPWCVAFLRRQEEHRFPYGEIHAHDALEWLDEIDAQGLQLESPQSRWERLKRLL